MPKKEKRTREEKLAESFFPVDEDNLKRTTTKSTQKLPTKEDLGKKTIEKKYSKPETEIVEKSKTLPKKRKYSRKKTTKKSPTKKQTYTVPKIKLKNKGYELIITEKPQAATKIATALGSAIQRVSNKVSYYEVDRKGGKIVVACAVGHLFTLSHINRGSQIPEFDIKWIPNYLVRKNDFTKRYLDLIKKLAKDAGKITVATDYDIEGEVIGLNVVRFICGQEDAQRMKFSTLTTTELNKAYENKSQSIDWGQAIAGETRHYLDWFYGINLSRALMNAIKTTGKFRIMSIGRVQGPALKLIVEKEQEIQKFQPQPYWQSFIIIDKEKLELKHNKDIFNKKELPKFENLTGKTAIAETKKTQNILPPNPPFNLTTLQTEAYKFYGITPKNTLKAAQSLYLGGLISYPRTSSQKLPDSIDYQSILDILKIRYKVAKLITKSKPIEGKKSDPAHPSIHPTGNKPPVLSGDEEKIYNLVVKRFLSLFCENAIVNNKKVTAEVDSLVYATRGSEVEKKAWMEIYPSKLKEEKIPDVEGEVKIIDSRIEEKETKPPKRFSPASILTQLEKKNLGTKATRAAILETLYDRNYVKEKSIEATPLGISLIETLKKHSPIIIDEELTRSFEREMEGIRESKKDFKKKEDKIIDKAKETITKISDQFKKNEKIIGKELLDANLELREQQKKENTLIQCPKCKKGNLAITYSRKTKRHFVACDAYPDCKNTFSLPPNGIIKKTDKICEECGFPMLMRLTKGRRPWTFCFNPECKTNEEWVSKSAKYCSEQENKNDKNKSEQA